MAQSAIHFYLVTLFYRNQEDDRSKNRSTYFEAITEGKKTYTLKQWLERIRRYTKRKYKIDIPELIRGAEMTQTGWLEKQTELQEVFIWGIGPEALYHMTRAKYKTEPDKISIKDLIRLFNEYF